MNRLPVCTAGAVACWPMATDTTERGLERLIFTALAGPPCDPPAESGVAEPSAGYGGVGWSCVNPHDYDREHCVDLAQLAAFLHATQPEVAEAVGMASTGERATHASPLPGRDDGPTRRKFLARQQGEVAKRGTSASLILCAKMHHRILVGPRPSPYWPALSRALHASRRA